MTKRDHSAEATRTFILAAGREIFAQRPYSDVSGLQICEYAGVTRGALQHHFGSKLGLFMTVFEGLQQGAYLQVMQAITQEHEPWVRARAGVAAFLDACSQPAYQTVVLKEGPAAIGWERWRELDADYYGNLTRAFMGMLSATECDDRASTMLVATMRGALTELSFAIARSDDCALARRQALDVIDKLVCCFRSTPTHVPDGEPTRVGVGQLRADASRLLDRVARGQTIHVTRRGRVVARLQQPAVIRPHK